MFEKSIYFNKITSAGIIILLLVVYSINAGHWSIEDVIYHAPAWRTMPLLHLLHQLEDRLPLFTHLLALAMIVAGAVVTMQTTIKNSLFGNPTHLSLVIYFALFATFSQPEEIIAPPLIALLMSVSLSNLFMAYGRTDLSHKLFSGLFYLGCIPLFYPSTLPLLLLLFVVIVLFESIGRETIVAIVAVATPTLLHIYILWLLGYSLNAQADQFLEAIMFKHIALLGALNYLIVLFALIPIAGYALYNIEEISIALMSRKRTFYCIIAYAISLAMLLFPSFEIANTLALAPAISIFSITALAESPKRWGAPLYLILIGLFLVASFF